MSELETAAFILWREFHDKVLGSLRLADVTAAAVKSFTSPERFSLAEEIRKALGDELRETTANEKLQMEAIAFANIESNRGFPFLYGLLSVALWSYLEFFIKDLLLVCLEHDPRMLRPDDARKIKMSILEFEEFVPSDRRRFVIDSLEYELKAKYKLGVGRFESLLVSFGLGGDIDETVRRRLLELSQVRNVLVHRGGRVDKRLADACPWITVALGDEIVISQATTVVYALCAVIYGIKVYDRLMAYCLSDRAKLETTMQHLQEILSTALKSEVGKPR